MHDALLVCGGHRVGDLSADLRGALDRQRPLRQDLPQRSGHEVLADEVAQLTLLPVVEHLHGVGVRDHEAGADLPPEAGEGLLVSPDGRRDHLDLDEVAVPLQIARGQDPAQGFFA